MKKLNPTYLLTLFFAAFAFLNFKPATQQVELASTKNVTLVCELEGCQPGAPLYLYQFDGMSFQVFKTSTLDKNQSTGQLSNQYIFSLPASREQFYFVGANPKQTKPIILGTEEKVIIRGNCNNIRQSAIEGSPLNVEYNNAINKIKSYQNTGNNLNRQLAGAGNDPAKQTPIIAKLKENDNAQINLFNRLQNTYPFVSKIVATKTYLSFPNNKGNYANEVDYYLTEFFVHLDLKDPALDHLPAIYETFRDYTTTLIAIQFDRDKIKKAISGVLEKMNPDSRAYRFALGGVVGTLQQKKPSGIC